MKSNAPWSVKGIERDARETAKEAARREGMTVGEWLSQVINSAGDPATSDGEIEGLKISDLVRAIEHLNKRVIHAEFKSAAAADDLARNLAITVERLQRLERIKPGEGGVELDARLLRIEEKLTDRQRIDALKALERVVSQAALQLDTTQKATATRIDAAEKQMQELASRFDLAGAVASDAAGAAPISGLQQTLDELTARVTRAEHAALEASAAKSVGGATDAEFVERTGARLRVLGDEIKRGGDQIKLLEALIKKLGEQIDAAERRSAEGVQKVTETIADLKTQVGAVDNATVAKVRQEIETAVAAAARRTDDRLAALQQSLEASFARVSAPMAPTGTSSLGAAIETTIEDDEAFSDDGEAGAGAPDTFGFDADSEVEEPTAPRASDDDDEFAFDLDHEEAEAATAQPATAPAASVFGKAAPSVEPPLPETPPADGLDAILAELDEFSARPVEPAPDEPASSIAPPESVATETPSIAEAEISTDLLKEARRVAKESAERESLTTRRKLTPKQRAILAAKIRRKRLTEQPGAAAQAAHDVQDLAQQAAPMATKLDPSDPAPERPSILARATGAVKALQAKFDRIGEAGGVASEPHDDLGRAEESGDPDITKAARTALRRMKATPITIALAVAIVLAAAALYFLVKDLMFVGKASDRETTSEETIAPVAESAAPQLTESAASNVATAAAADPRTIYFKSVTQLKAAKTDGDLAAAVKGLEEAAELGHPPAQLQLGELYKLGQGVEQDAAKARGWYERAARGGNVLAMHRIGVMTARGQGGPTDQPAAIGWFEKASGFGLVDSQYNLGAIYHPGGDAPVGGVRDAAKAYYWYALASKNGDEQAGALASGLASSLPAASRKTIDADVANWTAKEPDVAANEIAPAS